MAIERFSRAERIYHWANALAILFLGATGIIIWQDLDEWRINHVNVISQGHVWLGGGLLVLSGLLFLVLRKHRIPQANKRFNVGQKFNLRALQVLLSFMVVSGLTLNFGRALHMTKPLRGLIKNAHLASAAGIGLLVLGHLVMVLFGPKNRGILAAMLTGQVDRQVLERSNPEWLESLPAEKTAA